MVRATIEVQNLNRHKGTPKPAARSVASSGPRPAQQPASLPSITTAGTLRTPRLFARSAISRCFISSTVMSHEGHAILLTSLIVSSQQPQPALKISTFLLLFIIHVSLLIHSTDLNDCFRTTGKSIPQGCDHQKANAA